MSIKVVQLSKSYADLTAVDTLSFAIKKGEIVGFLGPNGAGKSTVMKILTGFIKDFKGEVFINEQSVRETPIEAQRNIGYLPEENPLYAEMYVKEYLNFNAEIYNTPKNRINASIDEVGLSSHAHKKIKELSKGYKQRVGLAAALLHDPEVLILDEPTTGLDPNQLVEIRALIKKVGKDKTVLFSTHIMQEVTAVCDRVIIINKGKIVADQQVVDLQNSQEQVIVVEFNTSIEAQLFDKLTDLKTSIKRTETTWELHFNTDTDKRSSVFDLAQENGLKILDLTRKNTDLEHLFRHLTHAT